MNWLAGKVLLFGLLGAAGGLCGWLLGEPLLYATLPNEEDAEGPTATLVSKPEAPEAPDETVPRPASPSAPDTPKSETATPPPPPEFQKLLEREGGRSGAVHLQLRWFNYNDLDLHCMDPDGNHISFMKKTSPNGGELDIDMNVSPRHSNSPTENIRWIEDPPEGKYQVFVHHYSNHTQPDPTSYEVTIGAPGFRETFRGKLSHGDPPKLIHEFRVEGARLQLAVSESLEIFQGGENELPIRVARGQDAGPVEIRVEGSPEGITVENLTIPAGSTAGTLVLKAASGTAAGTRPLTISARAGSDRETATCQLNVKEVPPVVRLAAPPEVQILAGGTNRVTVRVARVPADMPVSVRVDGGSEGLAAQEIQLAAGQSEAELELKAEDSESAGTRQLKVVALGRGTQAEVPIAVEVREATRTAPRWSWWVVLVIGLWTGLIALGLSLALVMGQNRSLSRPLIQPKEGIRTTVLGALAGIIAGSLGQLLFGVLAQSGLPPELGFVAGWLLLGALLGLIVCFVIPNLNMSRATAAGAIGGLIGAGAFLVVSRFGDVGGRFLGAAILGLAIGLMVVLVELIFRKVWLEVAFGPREKRTVNLGDSPVQIGSDSSKCAVWVLGSAPVALRYSFRHGQVTVEDVAGGAGPVRVVPGDARKVGSAEVTVCGGEATEAASQPTPVSPPPPPVAPVRSVPSEIERAHAKTASPPPPVPAAHPEITRAREATTNPRLKPVSSPPAATPKTCPGCPATAPGTPGTRYCMVCGRTF